MRRPIPPVVLIYGLLGVIPFVAPPMAGLLLPPARPVAASLLALYGGLILSFLGGARWAFTSAKPPPNAVVVSLSMLPSLVALALLAMPAGARFPQLLGLASALVLHWFWDLQGAGLPPWYGALRSLLTAGAVTGLVAGAIVLA